MPKKISSACVSITIAALCLLVAACNRAPDSSSAPGESAATAETGGFAIAFTSDPNPPRSGDNALDVTVKQADGGPVTDADVSVVFYMPAMPSMNMPEMRDTAMLEHVGEGRYRGTNHLVMAGTWNVTITISRAGEKLGGRKLSVIAK